MKAMILEKLGVITAESNPLRFGSMPDPVPRDHEVLLKVHTCGVCHTELDEIEGRTPPPSLPIIPGHQVVGTLLSTGGAVPNLKIGDRVGVAWIYSACGTCSWCLSGNENLCPDFRGTGRDVNGGYAEYLTVPATFIFPIPEIFSDAEAAPLLCAGAIGYRSLRLTGIRDGQALGLTGFGASAHLVIKMVRHRYPGTRVYVFARSESERAFAKELGAAWAGAIHESSPELLDAIIDTTPAWNPVVEALKNLAPAGRLVINAIRKEGVDKDALLRLEYPIHLWMEKEIKSVANVARCDVSEFLQLAAAMALKPEVQEFRLEEANRALCELKSTTIRGAKVLRIE
ncbi:MAG: zinc-dependent alcohol dehydrogenase family protein [bacterium]